MYFEHDTTQTTKILKGMDNKIDLTTNNTTQKHLQQKYHRNSKYDSSEEYKLKCMNHTLQYVGQTEIPFQNDTTK
jgi:hypothetical protein